MCVHVYIYIYIYICIKIERKQERLTELINAIYNNENISK